MLFRAEIKRTQMEDLSLLLSLQFNFNDNPMSHYNSQRGASDPFGEANSPSRTERVQRADRVERSPLKKQNPVTQRNPIHDSPSKYDIQFYQRKVNRLETDMTVLQDELSLTKFKLNKAEDFERKYEISFQQNQDLVSELEIKDQETTRLHRDLEQLRRKNDQINSDNRNLESLLQNEKKNNNQLKDRHEQFASKASIEGKTEKAGIEENHFKQMANLKEDFRSKQQKLNRQIEQLQNNLQNQSTSQKAIKFKLEEIKKEKNREIQRLNGKLNGLNKELSDLNGSTDDRVVNIRTELINNNEERIRNVRKLANDIEECLMSEIRNLNSTLSSKNAEIEFILKADRKFIQENQETQNGLKAHIKRLQDQIFIIQRENQIELFETISRLQTEYQGNINSMNDEFDKVRKTHMQEVEGLKERNSNLEKENNLLGHENKRVESEHKKLSVDKEDAIKMLSQKIISLESSKDIDLRNYTTSMKDIEMDAKSKLQDLHSAVQNKNTEFEILNAQLSLKNQELTTLIDEISMLRNKNREKMRTLETKNATEQNTLNDLISSYKKEVMELRRRVHELESEISDKEAQADMKIGLSRQDLESQKQANEALKARNQFLVEWGRQLDKDLKTERVSNVNILHDTNISRRETVQIREQVRVQLEAIKDKQVEQLRNVFKLEKGRLESDVLNKEHLLRDKKEELARLLAEYKKLQNKVGKSSKFSRGVEEEAKCKATLEAEILLTENIFNAINTQ